MTSLCTSLTTWSDYIQDCTFDIPGTALVMKPHYRTIVVLACPAAEVSGAAISAAGADAGGIVQYAMV